MNDEEQDLQNKEPRVAVGWREWLALPALGVPAIKVKIDTGARSSSLHAESVEVFERDGEQRVRFRVAPLRDHSAFFLDCDALLHDRRIVRSSNGRTEQRCFVRTVVEIAGRRWDIELSLTDRASMKFPMLLGREAMRGRMIVDPARSWLCGRTLPHTYRDHGIPRKERTR